MSGVLYSTHFFNTCGNVACDNICSNSCEPVQCSQTCVGYCYGGWASGCMFCNNNCDGGCNIGCQGIVVPVA